MLENVTGMATDLTQQRQQAHRLIDRLPEAQISGLVRFLETIVDPVAAALEAAPPEDEEISEEEQSAAGQARQWLQQNGGRGIPHEEAMRRLELE